MKVSNYRYIYMVPFCLLLLFNIIYAQYNIEWTATFQSIGFKVTFPSAPPQNCTINMDIKNNQQYEPAHPLSRISDTEFAGSLFFLEDDTEYLVRLRVSNPSSQSEVAVKTRRDEFVTTTRTVIYVSATSGNDQTGNGTVGSPYASIGRALEIAASGTKISVAPGVYYETLSITQSGTAEQPVIIEGEGKGVVLDGSDPDFNPGSWENLGGGVYRAYLGYSALRCYYNDGHIYPYSSLNGLRNLVIGSDDGALILNDSLYVKLPGNRSPVGENIKVSRFSTGITCTADYIQIRNLEIRFFGNTGSHRGIYFNGGSTNLVDNCYIHHNVTGVAFGNGADNNVVQNCEFSDTPLYDWFWGVGKPGGYERGAFFFYNTEVPCRDNIFRYNSIHDAFEGGHLYSGSQPTMGLDLYGNTFFRIMDDCLETDGNGVNIRICNNVFKESLVAISLAPAGIGPVYILNNEIIDIHDQWKYADHADTWAGLPIKFNHGSDVVSRNIYIYHNTIYSSYTEPYDQEGLNIYPGTSSTVWENVIFRNNIIYGQNRSLVNTAPFNDIDFDYDNLYTNPSETVSLVYWDPHEYDTLEEFQNATGQELHGMNENPLFVDMSGGDFSLQSESPLIDKGIVIPGINNDYAGDAPDIGAHEYGSSQSIYSSNLLPGDYALRIFPNPFNPRTSIQYYVSKSSHVKVSIYDIAGRVIDVLVDTYENPGRKTLIWEPVSLSSGPYFIGLKTNYGSGFHKIIFIK